MECATKIAQHEKRGGRKDVAAFERPHIHHVYRLAHVADGAAVGGRAGGL